jgi:AcrR family transcriptional regulator
MVEQQTDTAKQASRTYRMSRRLESVDQTRQRIAVAAFELHGEIGPAQTTISAVAERAGVQRNTVYKHFPDLNSLFQACTAHGLEIWGWPDSDTWRSIPDPVERLRHGLTEIYRVYRANARSVGLIMRDLPVFADVGGWEQYEDRRHDVHRTREGWAEPPAGAAARRRSATRFVRDMAIADRRWSLRRPGARSFRPVHAQVAGRTMALPPSRRRRRH